MTPLVIRAVPVVDVATQRMTRLTGEERPASHVFRDPEFQLAAHRIPLAGERDRGRHADLRHVVAEPIEGNMLALHANRHGCRVSLKSLTSAALSSTRRSRFLVSAAPASTPVPLTS